jgi:hypothetical protein
VERAILETIGNGHGYLVSALIVVRFIVSRCEEPEIIQTFLDYPTISLKDSEQRGPKVIDSAVRSIVPGFFSLENPA